MTIKRIGLMGCGEVAAYGHIPAMLETEGLELHALYDPSPTRLKELQDRYRIPFGFSDLEDFFASGVEAVTITSPAPCHRENVVACAAHGMPVLCEKPLAMDSAEGGEMVRVMADAQLSFYCGFCYRFSPVAIRIRELLIAGEIGEVRSLRLIYNWHLHGKHIRNSAGTKVLNPRREGRMEEGGPMVDCGTHQLDLVNYWLNSPIVKSTVHGAWVDAYTAPDHMWLHLDHESGAHSMVEISYAYTHTAQNKRSEFIYELIGTKGIIRYERDGRTFFVENEAGRQEYPFAEEKSFSGMYQEWSRALQSGCSELLTTAAEGVQVADLARRMTNAAIAAH